MKHLSKLDIFLIVISCIFALTDVAGLIYYQQVLRPKIALSSLQKNVQKSKNNLIPDTIQIIKIPSHTISLRLKEPDIYGTTMQYTSYQLKLRFTYLNQWWRKSDSIESKTTSIFVTRNANKVCIQNIVAGNSDDCANGQYILAFNKKNAQSFEQAIKQDILKGNIKDCDVNIQSSGTIYTAVVVPLTETCTDVYARRGTNRYFQFDSKFPDRFIFVNLRDTPIFANPDKIPWEKTLEFF